MASKLHSVFEVLLDNSAQRLFALADPTGTKTKALCRRRGIVPIISPYAIGEMIKGLPGNQFNAELCKRCSYVLALTTSRFAPDVDDAIEHEYEFAEWHPNDINPSSAKIAQMKGLLYECSIGAMPSHLPSSKSRYYSRETAVIGQMVQGMQAQKVQDLLVTEPFRTFLSPEYVYGIAKVVLTRHFEKRGAFAFPDLVERAAHKAAHDCRAVPYLASVTRVQLWMNWYVANFGTVPKDIRSDTRFLTGALAASAVATADKRMLREGPKIFPEVQFLDAERLARMLL
jgi:hypothetical protein